MAELAPRERLQPSLLDRLTDDDPAATVEPRERRVMSLRTLREGVLRDLAWLLNTTNLLSVTTTPALPHLANSVLNYGVPGLAGNAVSNLDIGALERGIRQAIWDFEPRLIRNTVSVKALAPRAEGQNKLDFEIEADLWAQPYPERLYLKTELDLERGAVVVLEANGRSTR
ncbi:type VI secretion system baseplate subunit TssE [Herbaspirillum sp. SJZ107]|uniref:type VI secretion system baseplate subunit TssE n=1 Tax=Herbaspirillum sp. SJZ107 TaxID=2572881 RepID=UPI0011533FAC|nr:type VI secretion system baseplate subunit TssE [Herbaspirillum sp. SJZ107]TQK08258.1 type VI secretion system protein ImpF [Herbaspirillum sp. SJZ107]